MSDQQPATGQDLADLEARLAATLGGFEARLSATFTEKLRESETKLLGAFFASQGHRRIQFQHLKAYTVNAAKAAELRIDNLEHRLLEVERRLLTDPPH